MFHKRDGQILKEGSLIKRAIGKSILTGPLNFKERWIVLTEKLLSYREKADEVKSAFITFFLFKDLVLRFAAHRRTVF